MTLTISWAQTDRKIHRAQELQPPCKQMGDHLHCHLHRMVGIPRMSDQPGQSQHQQMFCRPEGHQSHPVEMIRKLGLINEYVYGVQMHWSLWGVSHLGVAKLVNCNQILGHVADQDYIEFVDWCGYGFCNWSRNSYSSYLEINSMRRR